MNGRTIETVNALFTAASILIGQGVVLIPIYLDEKIEYTKSVSSKNEIIRETEPERQINPQIEKALLIPNEWDCLSITYTTTETEYIGRYFVTAYSDEETYSRETASGVEVHYSDNPYEPTTCAIDPKIHGFNELIAIDFGEELKVYITEDTGGNVKGLWVDCFVETMDEVWNWDTGYKSVYSVSYPTHRLSNSERRIIHEFFNDSLHYGGVGGGFSFGSDS